LPINKEVDLLLRPHALIRTSLPTRPHKIRKASLDTQQEEIHAKVAELAASGKLTPRAGDRQSPAPKP
jgi:hypothetical protein